MTKRKQSKKISGVHPLFSVYLVLFLGVSFGLAGYLSSWPNSSWQQLWILYLANFYILWGIIHHARLGSLQWKIIAEYAGVATILVAALLLALRY